MIIVVDINGAPHRINEKINIYSNGFACLLGSLLAIAMQIDKEFFVMIDGNKLYNPASKLSQFCNFKECSKECYRQYTTFLRTQNDTHYLIAQRRFLNDSKQIHEGF